jgi:hypothetical protein
VALDEPTTEGAVRVTVLECNQDGVGEAFRVIDADELAVFLGIEDRTLTAGVESQDQRQAGGCRLENHE